MRASHFIHPTALVSFNQISGEFMRKFIQVLLSAVIAIGIMGCSSTHDDGQLQRAQKTQEELDRNVGK
jgi:hypothetical protein